MKAFRRHDWRAALHGDPPLDFEAAGTVVVVALSAASLEIDESDNLFVGGADFIGGGDINRKRDEVYLRSRGTRVFVFRDRQE